MNAGERSHLGTKRPILVLTASAGAGHNMAARGVEAALRAAAPDETIEVHDVLEFTGPFFRLLYKRGYEQLTRHFPGAMGWLYDVTDRPVRGVQAKLRLAVQSLAARPIGRYLLARDPRLIINTHFLPAEIVAGMRRSGALACPQVTVTTDLEVHHLWVQPPTERYFTATSIGREQLVAYGVPAGQIEASGIPLRPAFKCPPDRASARRELGLDLERPVVLLLGGKVGFGRGDRRLAELIQSLPEVQMVAVAGGNRKLHRRLEAVARASRRVRVVGYTEEMAVFMAAADLAVTKPGGLTSSEAMACGLPLVIVDPIPGQETRNSDYLTAQGVAVRASDPRRLGTVVGGLLNDRGRLGELSAAARRLARPDAADQIARIALEVLGQARRKPAMCERA